MIPSLGINVTKELWLWATLQNRPADHFVLPRFFLICTEISTYGAHSPLLRIAHVSNDYLLNIATVLGWRTHTLNTPKQWQINLTFLSPPSHPLLTIASALEKECHQKTVAVKTLGQACMHTHTAWLWQLSKCQRTEMQHCKILCNVERRFDVIARIPRANSSCQLQWGKLWEWKHAVA